MFLHFSECNGGSKQVYKRALLEYDYYSAMSTPTTSSNMNINKEEKLKKRNAREFKRQEIIKKAYQTLKSEIPCTRQRTSRQQLIKDAIKYITLLKSQLENSTETPQLSATPLEESDLKIIQELDLH